MRQELGLPLIIADEAETERNKLFRASESESESTSTEQEPELEPESESRLESQPTPSTRPSPFQHQPSPPVKNPPSTITSKAKFTKTTITRTITPPISVPVRAESEEVIGNVNGNQDPSETDSTVASKEHEETDQTDQTDLSHMNWLPSTEQHGANDPTHNARDAKIDLLSNMVSWLLQRHRDGWTGSDAELATLEGVRKEVVSERNDVFESLLDQLTGQERKTTKYESIIKSVVGRVSVIEPETVHAPQAPFTKAIDGEWTLLWDRCRLLSRTILADRKFTEPDFQRLYESIEVTFSNDPHYKDIIQQSAQYHGAHENNVLLKLHGSLTRLLFIFVFEYPTPLLESQHSDLLKHLYTMIGAAGMSIS
ncbi:hypothetical protein P171DRAFT_196003 [Karstenula rhodostoma CBS 690.94]|uniref:Uncharacterized protein n=1 Tax=Karstenula rhodostoma CBS 690.94 TaxID=1392251 RepID=A0A9P4PSW7_9PLEO|nr:hypothetical protein P171DRAFT_196003 [Karstenula rhodostoma CBS 690.94]